MSLDSMAIATDGYVSRTVKKALIIAVAGYLNFQGTPILPDPPSGGGGGGGGGRRRKPRYKPDYGPIYINDYTRQKKEDEEIINILNAIFENI